MNVGSFKAGLKCRCAASLFCGNMLSSGTEVGLGKIMIAVTASFLQGVWVVRHKAVLEYCWHRWRGTAEETGSFSLFSYVCCYKSICGSSSFSPCLPFSVGGTEATRAGNRRVVRCTVLRGSQQILWTGEFVWSCSNQRTRFSPRCFRSIKIGKTSRVSLSRCNFCLTKLAAAPEPTRTCKRRMLKIVWPACTLRPPKTHSEEAAN